MTSSDAKLLLKWYHENRRDLPWRQTKDPYAVWISETMLQQTTTQAVLGYYSRFLQRFPTLKSLAEASLTEVYAQWSGLGYYSRARNLHRAAQELAQLKDFPKTHQELSAFPGFGPYTSRAVASFAFEDHAAVLDGNVIRVLCRKNNSALEWWRSHDKNKLQAWADDGLTKAGGLSTWNQAIMELGSQICLPKNPKCSLCPWLKSCAAFQARTQNELPLMRPKKKTEIWVWRPQLLRRKNKFGLVQNNYAPFLKKSWLLPGEAVCQSQPPKKYHFRHRITHHDIFVLLDSNPPTGHLHTHEKLKWVTREKVKDWSPFSLVEKVLRHKEKADA